MTTPAPALHPHAPTWDEDTKREANAALLALARRLLLTPTPAHDNDTHTHPNT